LTRVELGNNWCFFCIFPPTGQPWDAVTDSIWFSLSCQDFWSDRHDLPLNQVLSDEALLEDSDEFRVHIPVLWYETWSHK
jgi:hypothetical protein